MGNIHEGKERKTLETVLARINGGQSGRRKAPQATMQETVPEPNRTVLNRFHRILLAEELSIARICTLMSHMYRVSVWLGHRPFEELSREDIVELVMRIRNTRLASNAGSRCSTFFSRSTFESYKMTIKKFWRWLKNPRAGPEELKALPYPPEVRWIKRKRGKNGILPQDVWTPDEVNKLAGAAHCIRDRGFILALFGSGCRIGEFLGLRRRDVVFSEHGCEILVEGKTGSRRVRLTPAASVSMAAWLDFHPSKDSGAFVWVNTRATDGFLSRRLTYDWAYTMLVRLARKAGIRKPVRPHLMRHSLATYYAPKLTEAVMNEHFGWKQGGRTAAIYTHLSGKQVDDQILAAFGRKKTAEDGNGDDGPDGNKAIRSVLCPRCGLGNAPCSLQCTRCGFSLNAEATRKLRERKRRVDEIMNRLVHDPEFKALLTRRAEEMHLRGGPACAAEGARATLKYETER